MGKPAETLLSGLAVPPSLSDDHVPSLTEGMAPVTGGKVWYRVAGTGGGIPLLLLHGGPGFSSHYLDRLKLLSDERPVVFYDQLGAGRSERPVDTGLWRVERFVEELGQVRKALRLAEVHILDGAAVVYLPQKSIEPWRPVMLRVFLTLPPKINYSDAKNFS